VLTGLHRTRPLAGVLAFPFFFSIKLTWLTLTSPVVVFCPSIFTSEKEGNKENQLSVSSAQTWSNRLFWSCVQAFKIYFSNRQIMLGNFVLGKTRSLLMFRFSFLFELVLFASILLLYWCTFSSQVRPFQSNRFCVWRRYCVRVLQRGQGRNRAVSLDVWPMHYWTCFGASATWLRKKLS